MSTEAKEETKVKQRAFFNTYHQAIAKLFKQDEPTKHILKCSPPQQLFYLLTQYSLDQLQEINELYHSNLAFVVARMFSETEKPTCDFSKIAGTNIDNYHNIARAIARAGHETTMKFLDSPDSALKLASEVQAAGKITTIFDMFTRQGELLSHHIGLLMEMASCEYVSTNLMQRVQMLKLHDPLPPKSQEDDDTEGSEEGDDDVEEDLADTEISDEAEVAAIQLEDYDYSDTKFMAPEDYEEEEEDEEVETEETEEESETEHKEEAIPPTSVESQTEVKATSDLTDSKT